MWNYCKYCGKCIEDGVMCYGLPTGDSVCVDCCVAENGPVDAAPVVHGRLVREVREVTDAVSVKGWACSVCGGFVKNQPVDRWRYCPFCGTPFDGGDLDGQKV